MASIQSIRSQFPQYNDMSDEQLADALYAKHYSDMPRDAFNQKIGLNTVQKPLVEGFPSQANEMVKGATFGLNDEATAGLVALRDAYDRGSFGNIGNTYNQALDITRGAEKQYEQQNPLTSAGLQLVGGLAQGTALNAGAKLLSGTSLVDTLGSGNLAARMAKSAATGAVSGGAYGFGTGEGSDNRLSNAKTGAVIGGAIGAATPAVSDALGAAVRKLNTKSIIPNADEMRGVANQFYQKAEDIGGKISPSATNDFINKISALKPQTEEGQLVTGQTPFTDLVDKLSTLKDKPISLSGAQEIDEHLGDIVDSYFVNGHLQKQGKKILDLQNSFRSMIENATPEQMVDGGREGFQAWNTAKGLWSTSRRMADIEKIISRAEMTDNPATAIRTGFKNLYNNAARMRGFSREEAAAIKKAADSGVVTDTLKVFGSRLIPIISLAHGGGFTGDIAAAAGSMASRNAASALQVGKAENVAEMLARRGMGQAGIPIQTTPRISWLPSNGISQNPDIVKQLMQNVGRQ